MENNIYIGKIVGTHGIKGELKILSNTNYKDKVFCIGNSLYLENQEQLTIKDYRRHKQYDLLIFNSFNNINQVEYLIGEKVYAKREEIKLLENEYLLIELIGAEVYEDNIYYGKVIDIEYGKTCNYIRVKKEREFLIPIIDEYFKKFDRNENIIYTNNTNSLLF